MLSFIEINSIEFYVMSLTLAMAVIAILFGSRDKGPATTEITAMTLNTCVTSDDGLVVLQALDDGGVMVLRNGLPISDGDTVNIVVTAVGDKLNIVEKVGVASRSGIDAKVDGTAMIRYLPATRFHVRYESEITGQWALFTFSNHHERTASAHLKL